MTFAIRLFAVGVVLAVYFLPSPAPAQNEEPIAQVIGLTGEAAVIRPQERRALAEGMPLFRGDRIVTRPGARAKLRFDDGSALVVGESSEVTVRSYSDGDAESSTVLSLVFGIVRATVPKDRSGGFEIWTNATVAVVRYTDWIVIENAQGSAVFAAEGEVAVTARAVARRFTLSAGDGIDVLKDGEIRGPQQWGEGRVERVLDATRAP